MFSVIFEFRLRLDDIEAVGEFPYEKLPAMPPLGGLFYFYGERFNVSDVITKLEPVGKKEGRPISRYRIECSATYAKDDHFMAALRTLAEAEVRFEEEVLDMLLEANDAQ